MSYPVYIHANVNHIGTVLIPDVGIYIPAQPTPEQFLNDDDIYTLIGSRDLNTPATGLLYDNAHAPSGSTLILSDGVSDIPEADAANFLLMSLVPTAGPYSAVARNDAGEVDEDVVFDGTATVENQVLGTSLDANGYDVEGLPNPPSAGDCAASMDYVLSVAHGLRPKEAVEVLADTALSLVGTGAPITVDGVALATGNRVLCINQNGVDPPTAHVSNGIWVVDNTLGNPWTRPDDFPTGGAAAAAYTFVKRGTKYADTGWLCMNDSGSDTIDTHALLFTQFSGTGSQRRSIPFGAPLGIPSAGVRYLRCSEVPGSSAALRMLRNGTVTGLSIQVDALDAKEYEVYLSISGGVGILLTSFKNVLGKQLTTLDEEYTVGQTLTLIISKKAGEPAGASTFNNIVALLEIVE